MAHAEGEKRFGVVSGFLGAGKTTLMIALSQEFAARGLRTAVISNDLGGKDLADCHYTGACGCAASELKYQQGAISQYELLSARDELADAEDAVESAAIDLFSAYNTYLWAVEHGILN